ncbi:MAG TPA: S8 family serine peptidase [Frankiaceae bacterium]|nr:S8 family serine peptidase [Frankiaceae bacterium]
MADGDDFEVILGSARFDPRTAEAQALEAPAGARAAEAPSGGAYVVQVEEPLTGRDVARLRAQHGLALTDYVPDLAYVEQVPTQSVEALRRDPMVRAVVPYRQEFKLSPAFTAPDSARAHKISGSQRVRIVLFDDADPEPARTLIAGAGGSEQSVLHDPDAGGAPLILATFADLAGVHRAAEVPAVRWIEPVTPIVADDVAAASTIQSGSAGSAPIWDKGIHGEGEIIGMIDTAPPDIKHCYFLDTGNNTPRPGHRKIVAVRNASGTTAGAHATFVAGCAAGDDVNSPGTAAHRGGAWAAKLVCGNENDLSATRRLRSELLAARASGAFVHTNSWHDSTNGTGNPATYNQNARDVDEFTFSNENHLVLGSAGNTGEEQGPPGTAKNAICVAAAKADPNQNQLGDGNPGPTADGRRKPDLVAVGCGISSATVGTACGTNLDTCATSYATPHAAAAAAQVRQFFREGWYPTGTKTAGHAVIPTGALLKAVLVASAVNMTQVPGYPNDIEGFGLIQLQRALFPPAGVAQLRIFDVRHAKGVATRKSKLHTIQVDSSDQLLRVVLAWSEPPGTVGAANPIVNTLHLEVIAPDSTTYFGNVFADGVSTTGGAADTKNNVQMVVLSSPAVGKWTIRVAGTRINVGKPQQGYALAVVGAVKPSGGGHCFVATAVYGNADHPDVRLLREWRNAHLEPGARGRWAMSRLQQTYERVGPPAATRLQRHPGLAAVLRKRLFGVLARWLARHDGWRRD